MNPAGELDPKIRIRSPLRCDGIGSLDCGVDVESGLRLAIRWLPLVSNGEAAAKAMQRLPSHPTLPKIRGSGRVGAAAYVAMEFPEGKLLSAVLGEPMPLEALFSMGAEIADALAVIHGQGVFHGELCASSLLLVPGRRSILWDMPLVVANRLTDWRGEERAMASTVQRAPFLSPERAQGLPPSAAGDVYALGSLLCLAGGSRPPSGTTLAIVHQIASDRWRPEVPEGYPAPVRTLLTRMLSRDAAARPSAREVAERLGRPLPGAATPEPSGRSWRGPVAAVLVLIAVLAVTAGYLALQALGPQVPRGPGAAAPGLSAHRSTASPVPPAAEPPEFDEELLAPLPVKAQRRARQLR